MFFFLPLLDSCLCFFFFFKQKTAYEMSIGDWSSDVCSSDLLVIREPRKYQMPTTMPAMTTTQSHQRLFEGLAGDASVAEWLPGSRRSIDLSCPIHSLLTD